jgi:phosphohistidine phosphatase
MRLVIVRHGEAVHPAVDAQRPLSERGLTQAAAIGQQLGALGVQVAEIWHSSKERARQTAAGIAATLPGAPPPQEREGLRPNDPIQPVADTVATHDADIMVVSHLPFVQDLVDYLLSPHGKRSPPFPECGTVIMMRDGEGGWTLEQHLLP